VEPWEARTGYQASSMLPESLAGGRCLMQEGGACGID